MSTINARRHRPGVKFLESSNQDVEERSHTSDDQTGTKGTQVGNRPLTFYHWFSSKERELQKGGVLQFETSKGGHETDL